MGCSQDDRRVVGGIHKAIFQQQGRHGGIPDHVKVTHRHLAAPVANQAGPSCYCFIKALRLCPHLRIVIVKYYRPAAGSAVNPGIVVDTHIKVRLCIVGRLYPGGQADILCPGGIVHTQNSAVIILFQILLHQICNPVIQVPFPGLGRIDAFQAPLAQCPHTVTCVKCYDLLCHCTCSPYSVFL